MNIASTVFVVLSSFRNIFVKSQGVRPKSLGFSCTFFRLHGLGVSEVGGSRVLAKARYRGAVPRYGSRNQEWVRSSTVAVNIKFTSSYRATIVPRTVRYVETFIKRITRFGNDAKVSVKRSFYVSALY